MEFYYVYALIIFVNSYVLEAIMVIEKTFCFSQSSLILNTVIDVA